MESCFGESCIVKPQDINKLKRLGEKLQEELTLRSRLMAADQLELVIGTGGTAQSVKLTDEFDHLVRSRMIKEMENSSRVIADEIALMGMEIELDF